MIIIIIIREDLDMAMKRNLKRNTGSPLIVERNNVMKMNYINA